MATTFRKSLSWLYLGMTTASIVSDIKIAFPETTYVAEQLFSNSAIQSLNAITALPVREKPIIDVADNVWLVVDLE